MSDDLICLTTEENKAAPLVPLLVDQNTHAILDAIDQFKEVTTLCGKRKQNLMVLTIESYVFYKEYSLAKAVCPICAQHPDVALYLLSQL